MGECKVLQQRLDGYTEAVAHALKRKTTFDRKVLAKNPGEVIFFKGQLVQIYRNNLDYMFKTDHKLLPKWSTPQRIASWHLNYYTLKSPNGNPLPRLFSARCLQRFTPKEGTKLAEEQKLIKEWCAREEQERSREEAEEVAVEWSGDNSNSGSTSDQNEENVPNETNQGAKSGVQQYQDRTTQAMRALPWKVGAHRVCALAYSNLIINLIISKHLHIFSNNTKVVCLYNYIIKTTSLLSLHLSWIG